jgi:hypothetical protein
VAKVHTDGSSIAGPTTGGIDGILRGEYQRGFREGITLFMQMPKAVTDTLGEMLTVVTEQEQGDDNG